MSISNMSSSPAVAPQTRSQIVRRVVLPTEGGKSVQNEVSFKKARQLIPGHIASEICDERLGTDIPPTRRPSAPFYSPALLL